MPKQPPKDHVNPLLTDSRGEFTPPKGWGEPEEVATPKPPVKPEPVPEEAPLLYKATPSPQYIDRPFDRRYDKQAVNVNPYLSGAMEALAKELKQTKTEQLEEMMHDYLKKHQDALERIPELVQHFEDKMRKKHNL